MKKVICRERRPRRSVKRIMSIILSFMMLMSITAGLDFSAYALSSSGSCGDNVTYTFDSSTGTLTISGTGAMKDYSYNDSPFYNQSSIKEVVINSGVTSIGSYAFYSCTGLTSVTIGNGITSIGSSAFRGCTGLTSVTIGNGVTSIGNYAFSYCTGLTSITIPDSVTSIGSSAFKGCTGLTSITITDSVTSIDDYAFSGCTGLTSITIPDSVTSIGSSAFKGCTGLTSITITDSVTSIDDYAFSGCTGLTSITIPDGVTSISYYAFANCSSLTSITIPDNVTSIGNYAFEGCYSLTSITIPDSVTTIGSSAFKGCTGLTSITIPDSVTSMGSSTFNGCIGFTSITIPDSVTSIGSSAFNGCTGLTSITIPDSVTSIGSGAFSGCTGLKELTMPCSAKIYNSQYTFYNCTNIEKVTLTKGTGTMQNYGTDSSGSATNTYYQYTPWYISRNNFKTLVIEDGITSIGSYAFSGCTGLTSITIPDSVTSIGSDAFSGCTGLTIVTIPNSVTSIGDNAFYGCGTIIYPGTANGSPWGAEARYNIIENSFAYTDNKKTKLAKYLGNDSVVVIPDGVTSISASAFRGYTGLTSITIPDSVTNIGVSAFEGCTGLTSITIPDSVTNIGSSAFYGCGAIVYSGTASGSPWGAKVRYNKFENGFAYNDNEKTQLVKYLGNDSVVVIPDGVTSISASAFRGYTGLTSITIPDSVTNIGNYAFSVCTGLTSITIPDSVTIIGNYAFSGCTGLKELTMPCSAEIYNSSNTFNNCSNIEKVTLTKGTGTMLNYSSSTSGSDTYYEYTPWYISRDKLKTLVIEDGVTSIGNSAFYGCTGLERITIPSSVTSIGNNAFNTLTEVTIPASMKIDFSGFDGCTNLQKINLTPGSGTMADWSLDYQDSLWYKHKETIKEVKLEEGIKNISESAFYECTNLAKTNVPSTVDSIGRYAYYGCDNLRNLTISSMQCKIPDNPNTISSFATIYAPSGSTAEQYAVKYNRDFESTGEYVPALIPEGASVKVSGDKAVITLSDGSTITVPKDTKETVKNADGTYTVTLNDGKSVTVSSNTEITKTADGQLNVKATDNGKTTTVTVPSGSSVVKSGDSYKVIVVNGTETVEKTVAAGETVVIDKSGSMSCNGNHKWDKGVVTISATCTSEGVKTYTCSVCGNQKIEKLKKVAHKPVADKAVPATFVSAGKTAGTHCSVCGKIIVAQKPVAMLGAAKLSKVKKGKKSFTATWKSVANVDGYEIQYSLKKNMKKAKTKSVASSKKKLKVKKLKAKKKYYVRIRAYKVINGKKQYSAWSAKKKVKTK